MRLSSTLRTGLPMTLVLVGALCARGQDAPASEAKGMPPRAAPSDYQAHTQAGTLTLAAEFMRHAVPTPEAPYSTEDFVTVEVGLFGPPPKPKGESKPTLDQGGGQPDDSFHPIVRMPIERKRTMQQRVQRASMPEGDRALPAAGLLFFEYRGKPENIRSLELIYSGPAGKATLALQP